MIRRIESLGLAFVAAFAMSAVIAAPSQGDFTAGNSHTIITGEQVSVHELSVGSGFGVITCKGAKFTGTSETTSQDDLVVYPQYELCLDSFGRHVDVNINAGYLLTTPAVVTGAANWHIVVLGSMVFQITNSGNSVICTVNVTSQTNNNVYYHSSGGTVEMETSTNNLTTVTSGGVLNCGVSNGHHTGGTYVGMTRIKGSDTSSNPVPIGIGP
jgi:hypothetical protein